MRQLNDAKEKLENTNTVKTMKGAKSTIDKGLEALEEEEKKNGNAKPRVTQEQREKQQVQSRQKQQQQKYQQNRQRQNVQAQQNVANGNTYDQSRQTRGNQRKRKETST